MTNGTTHHLNTGTNRKKGKMISRSMGRQMPESIQFDDKITPASQQNLQVMIIYAFLMGNMPLHVLICLPIYLF